MEPTAGITVSVVIPVFNGSEFVADAVASVISQSHADCECIVIDDGSTDGSADVARAVSPSVRVFTTPNRGVAAARNLGAERARGSYLAFLDADDRWKRDRVKVGLAAMEEEGGAREATLSSMELVDEDDRHLGQIRPPNSLRAEDMLLRRVSFPTSSSCLLVRREVFEDIGGFDQALSTSADWDLTLRLAERSKLAGLPEELVEYRVRKESMSSDIALMTRDMRRAYREAFRRVPRPLGFRRHALARMFRMFSGSHFEANGDPRALGYALLSMLLDPASAPATLRASVDRIRGRGPTRSLLNG